MGGRAFDLERMAFAEDINVSIRSFRRQGRQGDMFSMRSDSTGAVGSRRVAMLYFVILETAGVGSGASGSKVMDPGRQLGSLRLGDAVAVQ